VTYPPYLKSLRQILASTPDHVLAAYFVTRVGFSYAKFLGPATPVRKATRRLQIALQGLQKGVPEDRQDFCQAYVDELEGLGLIGGKEFVDRTFAGDSKEKAESVIYSGSINLSERRSLLADPTWQIDIIDAFKDRLPEVDWMDSVSAKAAAKKVGT
jgi:endothelin-converting enzyme